MKVANDDPFFIKLLSVLKSQSEIQSYDRIFFLGGFEFSDSAYKKCRELIIENKLTEAVTVTNYNAQSDNVEMYYFEDKKHSRHYLLLLYDPVELFDSEHILDILEYSGIVPEKLKHKIVYEALKINSK